MICLENHLGDLFVHGQGTAKGARPCITDAKDVKGSLKLSVFTYITVQSHEYDIRETAKFDDIGSEKAVGFVFSGSFHRFQIRLCRTDA